MIFPAHCKTVGAADTRPLGNRVYFLSRYLVRQTDAGPEVVEVTPAERPGSMMREVAHERVLARPGEVAVCGEQVNLHDRADLIRRAAESEKRCTIFYGRDEHMTFVLDPDPGVLIPVHVYDIVPPRPHLSETVRELEATGIFGELEVEFIHHLHDIRTTGADVYPCRAAGFSRTLDADRPGDGDLVAGCQTARQLLAECYGGDFSVADICPLDAVREEPFVARCCRSERTGRTAWNGHAGAVVHWGASPREIYEAIGGLVARWREAHENCRE